MRARRILKTIAIAVVLYFALGALLHYVVFPEDEPPEWAYARSGAALETPTGERFELIRGAIETGGEFEEVHVTVAPGGHPAVAHIHPDQEERFDVLSGSLLFIAGGEEQIASAGQTVVVPPGTPHQFFNRSAVDASFIGRITPARKVGLAFGQLRGLNFEPSFLQMMLFSQEYDLYPASPPPAVVRVISFVLAPTARLLGYRSFYPEYAERSAPAAQQGAAAGRQGPGANPPR